MPRIPDAELEKIKQEISLERLVEAKGVSLKRHGQDLIGLCPFHDDKEPSLVVTPSKNLWHCLGACQAGGSVIDWVMKAEGVSFRHAVELLRESSPSLAAEQPAFRNGRRSDGLGPVKRSTVTHLETAIDQDADLQTALRQVIDYYHETLKQSPEALDYLQKRGLNSSEMIERFKLGFCNRTLGYHLPKRNRKAGAEIRSRLEEIGLVRESGHEHFRGSLVVPVFGPRGEVLEVYGRKINSSLRSGTPRHLYLPGPHRGVWNIEALQTSKEVILCEALIDALTFWCAGYRNVTSSYGIEGFTEEHLEAFAHHGTERVLLAYDRDGAGEAGAKKLAQQLVEHGMACFRILFPKGMDANSYARQVSPASKSLGVVIRSAVWLGNGKAPAVSTAPVTMSPPPAASGPELESKSSVQAQAGSQGDSSSSSSRPVRAQAPAVLAAKNELGSSEDPGAGAKLDLGEAAEAGVVAEAVAGVLPASPMPPAPRNEIDAAVSDQEVVIRFGDRRWRVRGLAKNLSYESLRVNLLCSRGDAFHVDSFDLYSARHRAAFLKQSSSELGEEERILKRDLGRVLLELERLQEQNIQDALAPKDPVPQMSEKEREAALELLRDPKLLDRLLEDFDRCGVVGEQTNKLVGYLAAVSRKLDEPLAIIIQSSSAAGKSSLMDSILAFLPSEERVKYSAMTGQSLFYMGETNLRHKVLAIVEEEGAERATYALKLLQSEGELTIASTGKDPTTGRLVTHEYHVEGPVMIFLTTTAIEIAEDLLNRCLVLTVDEERGQTRAIHKRQRHRRTLEGRLASRERAEILTLHQNAQRLLQPLMVVNHFANQLTFVDTLMRTRRDNDKYLTLIDSIALLCQYQRERKSTIQHGERVEYVEVTLEDIEIANRLAHQILGRSLDEVPPQTRRLLDEVSKMASDACQQQSIEMRDYRFSRRDVRERLGWSLTQVRVHLQRLVGLEYLAVHHGCRGQSFQYELIDSDTPTGQVGLVDATKLGAVNSRTSTWRPGGQVGGGWRGGGGSPPARVNASESKGNSESWRGGGESTSGAEKKRPHRIVTDVVEAG